MRRLFLALFGFLVPLGFDVSGVEDVRLAIAFWAIANGEAVYVPVGPSPLEGCVRYGRRSFRAVGRSGVG